MPKIEMTDAIFAIAERLAALDNIDVPPLVESLVRRHAEYIDMFVEMADARRTGTQSAPDAPEQD
jgi:hypothetical protein